MRKTHPYSVILIFTLIMLTVSCGGNKKEKSPETGIASVIEVKIEGMTCTGCEQTIQRSVAKLEGIKAVTATFTDGRAVIEYYPGSVDTLKIKDAITGTGYKVIKFSNIESVENSN